MYCGRQRNPCGLDTKLFLFPIFSNRILTHGELEATACFGASRFLTLNSARIASNETFFAKSCFIFGIYLNECACNCETKSLRLTCKTATGKICLDVTNCKIEDGKYSVKSFLLIVIFPVPSLTYTRAIELLRRPNALTTSIYYFIYTG